MHDSAARQLGKVTSERAVAHIAELRRQVYPLPNPVLARLAGMAEATLGSIARGARPTLPVATQDRILAVTAERAARAAGFVPADAAAANVRRLLEAGPSITRQRIGKSAKVGETFVNELLDTGPAFIPAKAAQRLESLLMRGSGLNARLILPDPTTPRRRVPAQPSRDHLNRLLTQVFGVPHRVMARILNVHEDTVSAILKSRETVSAMLQGRILSTSPEQLAAALDYTDADTALTRVTDILDHGTDAVVTTATIAAAAGIAENLLIKLLDTRPDYIPADLSDKLTSLTLDSARVRDRRRVPAGPTIAHLRMLLDACPGASQSSIDRAAGLVPGTTRSILTRQQRVARRTRDAVAALTAQDLDAYLAGLVPAQPTLTALADLHRNGWPTTGIARAAGVSPRILRDVLTADTPPERLPKTLADAVIDTAARIGNRPGPGTRVDATEPRRLARSIAAQQWSPERVGRLIGYPERAVRTLMTSTAPTTELGLAAGIARLARCLEGALHTPAEYAERHGWNGLAEQFRIHAPGAGPVQGPDPYAAAWAQSNGWFPLAAWDGDQVATEAIPGTTLEHSPAVERRAAQILTVLRASLPRPTPLGIAHPSSRQVSYDTGLDAKFVTRIWQTARFHTKKEDGAYIDEAMPARIAAIKDALHWYDGSPAPTAAEVVASLDIPQEGYPPAADGSHRRRRGRPATRSATRPATRHAAHPAPEAAPSPAPGAEVAGYATLPRDGSRDCAAA